MAKPGIAKLFRTGQSQAVRLPNEFRFEGEVVRIRRCGQGVLLEPYIADAKQLFALIDQFPEPFMPEGREQPGSPPDDVAFD